MKYKKDNKLPNTKNVRRKTNPAGVTTILEPKKGAVNSNSTNSNPGGGVGGGGGGGRDKTNMTAVEKEAGHSASGLLPCNGQHT